MVGCTHFGGAGRRPILLVLGPKHLDPARRVYAKPFPHPSLTPDRTEWGPAAADPILPGALTKAKPVLKGDIDDLDPAGAEEAPGREYPAQVTETGRRKPILVEEGTGRRLTEEETDAILAEQESGPVVLDNQPGPDEV